MPVSTAPPKRTKPTEAQIDAIVNKGGQPTVIDTSDDNEVKHINTRLTKGIIRQIDELRAKRPRKIGSPKIGVSLKDWIVEAVVEKLERDKRKKL